MAEGYIMDLRKQLGHIPMVIACASVIIYDEKRGVLLQKRKDNGKWCYHGGSIELGESAEEAAKRELFEEVGLKAGKVALYTVASGEEQHFFYPNKDEVYIVDTIFSCNDFSGEIRNEEAEVTQTHWFSFEDVMRLSQDQISQPVRTPLLNFVQEKIKNKMEQ